MRRALPLPILLLLVSSPVWAEKVAVHWVNPTTNVDGSALTNLSAIIVQWGSCNADGSFGTAQAELPVSSPATQTYIYPVALSPVCVRAQAETSTGLLSAWSNVVKWTPPATPGQPGVISGVIYLHFKRRPS